MLVHTEKTARETAILDAVLVVAKEIGASPTEVAIGWLLHKAAKSTTSLIPILGPRTREQLDATLGALDVTLSQEQAVQSQDHSGRYPRLLARSDVRILRWLGTRLEPFWGRSSKRLDYWINKELLKLRR